MTTEYALARFRDAVGILADETGGVRERLTIAFISQLSHIESSRDLPKHLAVEFEGIKLMLTTDEVAGDRGTVVKEVNRLSDSEASRIARRIYEMFLEIYDQEETRHEVGTDQR